MMKGSPHLHLDLLDKLPLSLLDPILWSLHLCLYFIQCFRDQRSRWASFLNPFDPSSPYFSLLLDSRGFIICRFLEKNRMLCSTLASFSCKSSKSGEEVRCPDLLTPSVGLLQKGS